MRILEHQRIMKFYLLHYCNSLEIISVILKGGNLDLAHETKKLHQNGTFHSRNVTFSTLPKQLNLVRTSLNQLVVCMTKNSITWI